MLQYGIVNAVNLDGGGSATYTVNGTLVNYPSDQWYVTITIQSKLQNLCPIPIIYMILYISTIKICLFRKILWRINVYSCLNQYERRASHVLTTMNTYGKYNMFQIIVSLRADLVAIEVLVFRGTYLSDGSPYYQVSIY